MQFYIKLGQDHFGTPLGAFWYTPSAHFGTGHNAIEDVALLQKATSSIESNYSSSFLLQLSRIRINSADMLTPARGQLKSAGSPVFTLPPVLTA